MNKHCVEFVPIHQVCYKYSNIAVWRVRIIQNILFMQPTSTLLWTIIVFKMVSKQKQQPQSVAQSCFDATFAFNWLFLICHPKWRREPEKSSTWKLNSYCISENYIIIRNMKFTGEFYRTSLKNIAVSGASWINIIITGKVEDEFHFAFEVFECHSYRNRLETMPTQQYINLKTFF
jgi:hypothetical protein